MLTRIYNSTGQLGNAGRELGSHMIGGWIDGLNDRAGALYDTIARIVSDAIATANAEAGVASPSKPMIQLGNMMAEGLSLGLGASRADLERAMTGMMADTMAPAYAYTRQPTYTDSAPPARTAPQLPTGGGLGGVTVNVKTLEPSSVAHQVGLTMNRLRIQAELDAGRG